MEQRCEVCESFRPRGDRDAARGLLEVSFGERRVLLCRGHAGIARNSEVSTFEELRSLYAESDGKRSFIARRSQGPQPDVGDTRPRSAGRRSGDSVR